MINMMKETTTRLEDINCIVSGYGGGTLPFEQAFALARFYYDFQDTNSIIAAAECSTSIARRFNSEKSNLTVASDINRNILIGELFRHIVIPM